MALKITNNASSTLSAGISAAATTATLAAGTGTLYPALGAGDWFPLTLTKLVSGLPVYEIVKVTARSGDNITFTRAQEGTTATTFSAGDRAELRLTAAALDEFARTDELRGKNIIDGAVTNATATGTVTLDFNQGDVFDLALSGAATLALSNLPVLSNEEFTFVVRVSQGATAYALTWFAGITWLTSGGAAPAAPAANKTIEYVISTKNGTAFTGRKGASN